MDKRDFFMHCMKIGKFKNKRWILRAFSLVRENKTVEQIGLFDILQTPAGFMYKGPGPVLDAPHESGEPGVLEPITGEGLKAGTPMFQAKEKLFVKAGELPGILKDEETDYARILYYCIVFLFPFGGKVPFQNKQLNMFAFEDELASKLDDDVETREMEKADRFYPRELIAYYEAMAFTRGLAMLFVPAASPKSMTIAPEVIKRRDELFNDPKVDMDNQAVAAQVEMELVELDKKSFEGDTASGFLINKKDFAVIRKKRFVSFGSGAGLTPDSKTPYVKNSLRDGIDISKFKAYNDEMRTGSYKRGVETMFGGELDKWLVRESSNIRVDPNDCKSTVGIPTKIDDFNKLNMLGKSIVAGKETLLLTADNIGTYMGKVVLRRTPAACWKAAPDYCAVCLGDKLSMNPDAISIAFSQYGHDFMGESMSAMHGKSLTTARMDLVSEAS